MPVKQLEFHAHDVREALAYLQSIYDSGGVERHHFRRADQAPQRPALWQHRQPRRQRHHDRRRSSQAARVDAEIRHHGQLLKSAQT